MGEQVEWRFVLVRRGGQYATGSGPAMMLKWCASNWDGQDLVSAPFCAHQTM